MWSAPVDRRQPAVTEAKARRSMAGLRFWPGLIRARLRKLAGARRANPASRPFDLDLCVETANEQRRGLNSEAACVDMAVWRSRSRGHEKEHALDSFITARSAVGTARPPR